MEDSSLELPLKKSHAVAEDEKANKSISLLQFCKDVVPACRLNPLLFNGHLQTFWTAMRSYDVPIYYKRRIFEAEDQRYRGSFAVDFAVAADENAGADDTLPARTTYYSADEDESCLSSDTDETPMAVLLHGLSGGSHEIYLRHVVKPLQEAGWAVCVVNSRGCAQSKLTSGVLYNARSTWDVRQVVNWLHERFPKRPLFGIGFSLGANILTNYLGEEGARCLLKAAVVLSNPWNLDAGARALWRTWLGREVYTRTMGTSMKQLFEQHVDMIGADTNVDIDRVRKIRYLFEFDRELQGPTWGYPTEGAYYRDASSSDSLLAITIPLLAIHALDDPVAASEGLPYQEFKQTANAVLCTTSLGGHLSWFEGSGGRWFVKPTVAFLNRMATEVDFGPLAKARQAAEVVASEKADPHERSVFLPMRRKLDFSER